MTRARDIADRNVDSTTIDGVDSTQLLRSDVADTKTAGDLSFADSVKAQFGASNDLQIYHDGSNSYILDTGTGGLYLKANADFYVQSQGTDETFIQAASNAFVKLFFNGSEKLATTSTGIDVTGVVNADSGTHTFGDGTNSSQLVLLAGTTGTSTLDFGDSADNNIGRIQYEHSNDALTFRTNNSEAARITSGGNVGIGESSPNLGSSGSGLHITGASSKDGTLKLDSSTANYSGVLQFTENGTDQWRIAYDATNNHLEFTESGVADRMVIADGGNVGIGITPTEPLHIDSGSATTRIKLENDGTAAAGGNGLNLSIDNSLNATLTNAKAGILSFGTSNVERARFSSDGKFYIGRTSDPYMSTGSVKRLSIDGGTTSTDSTIVSNKDSSSTMYHFYFHNVNSVVGSISTNGHATSFNTSSDHRLKENVADITGAIARVKSLQPKRFNWITEPDTTIDGFLAHEAATVVPESVTGSHNETRAATGIVKAAGGKVLAENVGQADWTANKGDDEGDLYPSDSTWTASEDLPVYQTMDQAKLVPLLTGALKEAIAKIEALETSNADLIARIETLESAE